MFRVLCLYIMAGLLSSSMVMHAGLQKEIVPRALLQRLHNVREWQKQKYGKISTELLELSEDILQAIKARGSLNEFESRLAAIEQGESNEPIPLAEVVPVTQEERDLVLQQQKNMTAESDRYNRYCQQIEQILYNMFLDRQRFRSIDKPYPAVAAFAPAIVALDAFARTNPKRKEFNRYIYELSKEITIYTKTDPVGQNLLYETVVAYKEQHPEDTFERFVHEVYALGRQSLPIAKKPVVIPEPVVQRVKPQVVNDAPVQHAPVQPVQPVQMPNRHANIPQLLPRNDIAQSNVIVDDSFEMIMPQPLRTQPIDTHVPGTPAVEPLPVKTKKSYVRPLVASGLLTATGVSLATVAIWMKQCLSCGHHVIQQEKKAQRIINRLTYLVQHNEAAAVASVRMMPLSMLTKTKLIQAIEAGDWSTYQDILRTRVAGDIARQLRLQEHIYARQPVMRKIRQALAHRL